jgi:hypothetical protein
MLWFKRRTNRPQYLNGHLVRGSGKSCPLCQAAPDQWCKPGCTALDVMDYR